MITGAFVVEIHPKSAGFDPAARPVSLELREAGVAEPETAVRTCRLYRLEGAIQFIDVEKIATALLVDPVVEIFLVVDESAKEKKKSKAAPGLILDVWPKPGVTDPVAETVAKGLRDLGFLKDIRVATGQRYEFPKLKDRRRVETLARRSLANELIHDLRIRNA